MFLGGCGLFRSEAGQPDVGVDINVPADFSFKYEWLEGSMPPPNHYEYLIKVDSNGSGRLEYRPDYEGAGTPLWTEDFSVPAEKMAKLYKQMSDTGVFEKNWKESKELRIGGAYGWLEVVVNGKNFSTPSQPVEKDEEKIATLYDAVITLIDEKVWDKMEDKRQDYIKQYIKEYGND